MHYNKLYNKYCEPCEVPVCDSCSYYSHKPRVPSFFAGFFSKEYSKHTRLGIRAAYKTKRQYYSDKIQDIRSDTLYYGNVLLKRMTSDINIDVQICKREIKRCQYEMIMKSKAL